MRRRNAGSWSTTRILALRPADGCASSLGRPDSFALPVKPNPSEVVGVDDGVAVRDDAGMLDDAGVVEAVGADDGAALGGCDARGAGVGL
jgi:hypothetical protein